MKIYLAIPYSGIEEESFRIANYVAHKLMKEGHIVYSPISHNHPIAKEHCLPTTWDFWEKFDTAFIEWCEAVKIIIPDIEGRDGHNLMHSSKGVQAELKIARKLGKEITYHYANRI